MRSPRSVCSFCLLACVLVARPCFGAVLAPEGTVDEPVPGPAFDAQSHAAAAFDGTNYLFVWEDRRLGLSMSSSIYAARVRPDGTVLDATGIALPGPGANPAVAFDGTNFVVVWDRFTLATRDDVFGARVSRAGVLLDAEPIPVVASADDDSEPEVACGAGTCLVVWTNDRDDRVYAARVTPQGRVQDAGGFALDSSSGLRLGARVGFDGTNFLAIWNAYIGAAPGLAAVRVAPDGRVLDSPARVLVPGSADSPDLAFNGTEWLMTYGGNGIAAVRVRPDLFVQGSSFSVVHVPDGQSHSRVVAAGGQWFVTWFDKRDAASYDDGDVYGARIGASGGVLDTGGFPIQVGTKGLADPMAATDGTAFLVAWTGADIDGKRVSAAGSVLDATPRKLSVAASSEITPAVAFDGTQFLVAWADNRDGNRTDIRAARVSRTGAMLDPSAIRISTPTGYGRNPAVAAGPGGFLVAWEDYRNKSGVWATRVDASGRVLDPGGIEVFAINSENVSRPSAAFDGTNYWVVWEHGFSRQFVAARRVSPQGAALGAGPLALQRNPGNYSEASHPAIACDGASCLAVWDREEFNSNRIHAARLLSDGTFADAAELDLGWAGQQAAPCVAAGAGGFAVLWRYDGLALRRVTAAGALNGDAVQVAAGTSLYSPAIAWDGRAYAAAWRRWTEAKVELFTAWVSPDGVPVEAAAPVALPATVGEVVSLAGDGTGRALLAYSRFDPDPRFNAWRVRARLASPGTAGAPCSNAATCPSTYCVDGRCCDSPCGGGATDCMACSVAAGAALDGTCGPVRNEPVCRAARDGCDVAERCSKTSTQCPPDLSADNAGCDDGNPCTDHDACSAGVCRGTELSCAEPLECHGAARCDPATTGCTSDVLPDGTACTGGTCRSGECVAQIPASRRPKSACGCSEASMAGVVGLLGLLRRQRRVGHRDPPLRAVSRTARMDGLAARAGLPVQPVEVPPPWNGRVRARGRPI